jgi:predicted nucleic acid-binding protein
MSIAGLSYGVIDPGMSRQYCSRSPRGARIPCRSSGLKRQPINSIAFCGSCEALTDYTHRGVACRHGRTCLCRDQHRQLPDRNSRDLIVAGHQQLTHEWWQAGRPVFETFVSELVLQEAGRGDPEIAAKRLAVLDRVPQLEIRSDAVELSRVLLQKGPLPQKAAADALHIAVAAVHGLEFLLTWNCKHIANAEMRPMIEQICRARGVEPPVLCTPNELMGG